MTPRYFLWNAPGTEVFCVLDRHNTKAGGNRFLPFHECPAIVYEAEGAKGADKAKSVCIELNSETEICAAI